MVDFVGSIDFYILRMGGEDGGFDDTHSFFFSQRTRSARGGRRVIL
jgi:hypothetical protein